MKAGEWWGGTGGGVPRHVSEPLLLCICCYQICLDIYYPNIYYLLLSYLFRRISGVVVSNKIFCAWSFMWHGNSVEPHVGVGGFKLYIDMTTLKTATNNLKSRKHGNSLEPGRQIIEEDGLVGFISRGHDNKPIGVKHTTNRFCRREGCMPPFIFSTAVILPW